MRNNLMIVTGSPVKYLTAMEQCVYTFRSRSFWTVTQ